MKHITHGCTLGGTDWPRQSEGEEDLKQTKITLNNVEKGCYTADLRFNSNCTVVTGNFSNDFAELWVESQACKMRNGRENSGFAETLTSPPPEASHKTLQAVAAATQITKERQHPHSFQVSSSVRHKKPFWSSCFLKISSYIFELFWRVVLNTPPYSSSIVKYVHTIYAVNALDALFTHLQTVPKAMYSFKKINLFKIQFYIILFQCNLYSSKHLNILLKWIHHQISWNPAK